MQNFLYQCSLSFHLAITKNFLSKILGVWSFFWQFARVGNELNIISSVSIQFMNMNGTLVTFCHRNVSRKKGMCNALSGPSIIRLDFCFVFDYHQKHFIFLRLLNRQIRYHNLGASCTMLWPVVYYFQNNYCDNSIFTGFYWFKLFVIYTYT